MTQRLLLTTSAVPPGDDLRTSGPYPGLPERTQQAAVTLLPRGDAEEPPEAAGDASTGGAAEDGSAAQAGGGDGEEEERQMGNHVRSVLFEGFALFFFGLMSPS